MDTYLPMITEIAALLLIWMVASGLSHPLRLRLRREIEGRVPIAKLTLDILARISRPLLILVLSEVLIWLIGMWNAGGGWLDRHSLHHGAWIAFWLGVSVIALVDGFAHAFFHSRAEDFPIPDLLWGIIRSLVVMALAFMIIRVELGFDIGPLLASTALLTAVIGFALQGVLGNLMAGMSLHLVRSLRPGVWIEIDGIEGKVVMTNWRETRVRTRGGHVHIIPNAKVAEARIHNMSDPSPIRVHTIDVGASYSDAPDAVIAALVEAAKSVPAVMKSPEPFAVITAYLDFGINYRLGFWSREYSRHILIDGEVNRMIWYKFKRRGIEIPFPMSDKLLNDFMAVVYNQRKLPPSGEDVSMMVEALENSDLYTKLVVDDENRPLMTRQDLGRIAPLLSRLPYTHGEVLCEQGAPGETFWVLVSGKLGGRVGRAGDTAIRFEMEPGAVVGEMSALTGAPRSATIEVIESAVVLEFGPEAFRMLLSLNDEIPERLSSLAAERAEQNRDALEALAKQQKNTHVEFERAGILGRLRKMIGK